MEYSGERPLSTYYQTANGENFWEYQAKSPTQLYPSNFNSSPILDMKRHVSTLKRLENAACLKAYETQNANWTSGNVLVVTDGSPVEWPLTFAFLPSNSNGQQYSLLNLDSVVPSFETWWCGIGISQCDNSSHISYADQWTIAKTTICTQWNSTDSSSASCQNWVMADMPVKYCLAEVHGSRCKIEAYPQFILVVVICNLLKIGSVLAVLFQPRFQPLATFGDAVSSFLSHPDPQTQSFGALTKARAQRLATHYTASVTTSDILQTCGWKSSTPFWFKAASLWQWLLASILSVCLSHFRMVY